MTKIDWNLDVVCPHCNVKNVYEAELEIDLSELMEGCMADISLSKAICLDCDKSFWFNKMVNIEPYAWEVFKKHKRGKLMTQQTRQDLLLSLLKVTKDQDFEVKKHIASEIYMSVSELDDLLYELIKERTHYVKTWSL